jgi:hypothetical protein
MRYLTPALLLLLVAAVPAQSAAFSTFGAGCTFQNQTLAIGARGLPQLGTLFAVTYSGPCYVSSPGQQIARPMLGLGFAPTNVVLPANLLPQQVPNCTVWIQPQLILPTQVDPVTNNWAVPMQLPLPNQPALLGLNVLAQWVTLFSQCGFAGCGYAAVLTSDAAIMTLGR